jgi:GntR family transcriptional regulator
MGDRPGRSQPKFLRIAEDLRAAMAAGTYKPGDQLPTKTELQQRYGVAINTVDRAIEELRKEGLAETVQGRGTFARTPPEAEPSPAMQKILDRIGELDDEITRLHERMDHYEQRAQG